MLPENFDVMFCAGPLPKYARKPEKLVFDFSSRLYASAQRHKPVIQPLDKNWKPGAVSKAVVADGKWTFEAFVPFAAYPDFAVPQVGESRNVNVVRDKSEKGLGAFRTIDSVSSAFTMDQNGYREMFGTLKFVKYGSSWTAVGIRAKAVRPTQA